MVPRVAVSSREVPESRRNSMVPRVAVSSR